LYTTTVHLSTYQFQQDALWFVWRSVECSEMIYVLWFWGAWQVNDCSLVEMAEEY
jgi:hypothetical protein